MTISRRSAGALGLLALATLGSATAAYAQSDLVVEPTADAGSITRTMKVDISDINLGTAQGRERLERRVTFAAKAVCDYNGSYGLRQPRDYYACFDEAKAGAMSDPRAVQTAANGYLVVASRGH
ncbi:MAG: UrcA family protein [Sphingobium phenoxybenzoativorans]|uniref:UrcA family protein n=1 Tax=Sphingobium phenoxybenzoativorans TaxID=1592790 RepID=A0A975Q0I9_9SPHN|nr:UrcA family protein [Sphingobium phenoxybenzoativorans]QUT04915.1 UrcA family protein [Sphingobium phenoxybenzoativorans]